MKIHSQGMRKCSNWRYFFGFFNNLTVAMVMNVRNCFLFLHPVFKDYNYIPKASRKYVYWGYSSSDGTSISAS